MTDLIWGLSARDLGALFAVGVAVSASAWMVTEYVKRGGLASPRAIRVLPFAYCAAVTAWLFPAMLSGVAPAHTMPLGVQVALVVTVLTPIGGIGARAAHDHADRLLQATIGRALDIVRPRSS